MLYPRLILKFFSFYKIIFLKLSFNCQDSLNFELIWLNYKTSKPLTFSAIVFIVMLGKTCIFLFEIPAFFSWQLDWSMKKCYGDYSFHQAVIIPNCIEKTTIIYFMIYLEHACLIDHQSQLWF